MTAAPEERTGRVARGLAGVVHAYQLVVSPWFAPRCRYYPSCSTYAIGALRTHGAIRGTGLAVWRVLRCNPWSRGGVDPVPPRRSSASARGRGTGSVSEAVRSEAGPRARPRPERAHSRNEKTS